jgi:hypothetical protein
MWAGDGWHIRPGFSCCAVSARRQACSYLNSFGFTHHGCADTFQNVQKNSTPPI